MGAIASMLLGVDQGNMTEVLCVFTRVTCINVMWWRRLMIGKEVWHYR